MVADDLRPLTRDDLYRLDGLIQDERGDDDLNVNVGEGLALARSLADNGFGYFRGLALLGFASVTSDRTGHSALLRVHVRRDKRREGIGAHLVREAIDVADFRGHHRLVGLPYVTLAPDRRRLSYGPTPESMRKVAFFERHGFELEGYMRDAARLQCSGRMTDVALLARIRRAPGA